VALRRWLREIDDEAVLTSPRILDLPAKPTITEVRRDQGERIDALVIKIVETRIQMTLVEEREQAHDRFIRVYQREKTRAVNVVRLRGDGLLEVRIFSHRGHGKSYKNDLNAVWSRVAKLLDPGRFVPISIMRAKQAIWEQRSTLGNRIRFSNSELRNSEGTKMQGSSGDWQRNLFDDSSADAGLRVFAETGEAYCDSHNVWWVRQDTGVPSRDIHVLLAGEVNEFAVTQQCSREEYEYVLSDIQRFNR
jgi:hypothetical protein